MHRKPAFCAPRRGTNPVFSTDCAAVIEPPETRYATTKEGLHIAYQVVSDGPLDIVMALDGPVLTEVVWDEPRAAGILRRLASFSRLVIFDRRGFGASDPIPASQYPTVEESMDDVGAVMDTVGSEQAALVMVGHTGGDVGIPFAASYPERVSALVVINGSARVARSPDYPIGMPPHAQANILHGVEAWGSAVGIEVMAPSRADEAAFRAWYTRAMRLSSSPAMARANTARTFELDVRAILGQVRVPTLVLHAAANSYIRASHGRYLADHIPDARFVELPDDGYILAALDPDPLVEEIEEFLTGVRQGPQPDRVLATVLFTDIVGSTEHATRLGDRQWRSLLDDHDALVRRQLERFSGRLVKTTGDGLLATFDGPARAVRCACAIRDGLKRLGIDIRAGLHTGEVELRGDDVGGVAVHLAARVQALAGPDEVLVSRTVTDLVTGSGIAFSDRGEHELKGVPGRWRLFRVEG
jgi:class 3 adenylate cyclase